MEGSEKFTLYKKFLRFEVIFSISFLIFIFTDLLRFLMSFIWITLLLI